MKAMVIPSLIALVAATGCLGPRADRSAFFLLSPAQAPTSEAPVNVTVGIGPVDVPAYLDRPQIVVRVSDHEIALAESDRWGEPLADGVARVLKENLWRLLPGSAFVDYPWYPAATPDLAIAVEIRRFEADSNGGVTLDATWSVSRGEEVVESRASLLAEAATGLGRSESVAAQSRALAALGREIAAAVRGAHGG